ncbi:uncharacterized protein FIESC28_07798 [Fusarium coffeatum]|uniref:Extracellular membrane protein CFEM domain-containing protein n=1 Tax=Fusarium coffeatum TaxID=231269 RepID=A0A366RCS2_9HYPO|nr:uncharacterized protein FIESC28_07798 [Fusarium coffeatum]RBR14368.1 hypothetical protein FIESC28_07798 [Fusarium coffeatum]
MVSSRLFAGFVALASIHAANAGACRPRPSSTIVYGTDTTLTTAETSFQTSIEAETSATTLDETTTLEETTTAETPFQTSFETETSAITADETTTLETTAAFTTAETSIETSFVTEDDLTTTLETTQNLDFTTDITSFITLTADPTTTEAPSTTSRAPVPADIFPCMSDSECEGKMVEVCDRSRCGCVDGFCGVLQVSVSLPIIGDSMTLPVIGN